MKNKGVTALIVQARMDSKRLPNKMSLRLGNYSIIEWVLKRVKKSQSIDRFILATSHAKTNDYLENIALKNGFEVYRGSESDVFSRFSEIQFKNGFDNIVRVCADNPFVSSDMIDELVSFFMNSIFDYAFNHRNLYNSFYPDGFGAEIFSSKALRKINQSELTESHLEHVTSYIFDNLGEFSIGFPKVDPNLKFPYLKFDVDTELDIEKLRKLIKYGNITIDSAPQEIVGSSLSMEFDGYLEDLFPLCRSLTGEGNRKSLNILSRITPIDVLEVQSGFSAYDWTVPDEWGIRAAYIKDAAGNDLVNFAHNNLHLVSYSQPINATMWWDELSDHIHVHPALEDAVPYRTTYYEDSWGFCVTHKQREEIKRAAQPFSVLIDSEFKKGSMSYGEILIKGAERKEVLISTYICHPSMVNDSLSGFLLTTFLARHIRSISNRKYSYRFVLVPETIGAITYLALNEESMRKIDTGLVITTVGGPGNFGYKKSWDGGHHINQIIESALIESGEKFLTYPFDIHGSDERQYSSQGFRINVATLAKDKYYEYPEYHSSLDNLNFVNGAQITETFLLYCKIFEKIEKREIYENLIKNGEVMLSRHDLYPRTGGSFMPSGGGFSELDLILWILFYSDGKTTVEEISKKIGAHIDDIRHLSRSLMAKGVLKSV